MKTAIYIRVSTDEQAEGYSLEVQEESLRKFVKDRGWDLYCRDGKVYSDDETGYSLKRPALRKMLSDARAGKFDTVLVYKLDRFSRNLKHLLMLVDELELLDIRLVSATEPYDTGSSAGRMVVQQLGMFAEFERNRIVERVVPGMKKSAERGNWQGGKPPYGYRYNKEKKLLVVHPEEAEMVRLIYKMYLQNKSILQICAYLFENGYRSRCGGRIYTTLVCDILKNKIYLGKLEWGRYTFDPKYKKKYGLRRTIKNDPANILVFEGRHEALISQEDYDLVGQKLVANRKGRVHRNGSAGYPLTGIMVCAKCKTGYRGALVTASRKTKAKRRVYRCCSRHDYQFNCPNPCVWSENVEGKIWTIFEALMEHPHVKEGRMRSLISNRECAKDDRLKDKMTTLKGQLNKNLDKQKKLLKTFLDETVSQAVFKDESLDLRVEEQRLKREMAKLDMQMVEKERSEEYQALLQRVVAEFDRIRSDVDLKMLKEALSLVFKRIVLDERTIIELELYEPFQTYFYELNLGENLEEKLEGACVAHSSHRRAIR